MVCPLAELLLRLLVGIHGSLPRVAGVLRELGQVGLLRSPQGELDGARRVSVHRRRVRGIVWARSVEQGSVA